jgi:membrane dipeptidase
VNLDKMQAGDAAAQCFAIFNPTPRMLERMFPDRTVTPQQYHAMALAAYQRELTRNADRILPAYTVDDILCNREKGKMSAILTIEDLLPCEGKAERIEQYYDEGARIMGYIWNFENALAYPNSSDPEIMNRGLKDFGKEMVDFIQDMGAIIDVSHLNDGGFWDLVELAKKPFVATHSNARSVCAHKRNLTDDMIREMVKRDCLIGLNYFVKFLENDGNVESLDQLMKHIEHFFALGAEKNLALGSDFDGAVLPECLSTPAKAAGIYGYLLERGMSREQAEGIMFRNAQEFLKKNL